MSTDNQEGYKKITRLRDTIGIPIEECNERMVLLDPKVFKLEYKKLDMLAVFGSNMYLRQSVEKRLKESQRSIQSTYPDWKLLIAYAYRTPDIQSKYFYQRLTEIQSSQKGLTEEEQKELAHSMSAHPDSAGHTTGGAVDLTIFDNQTGKEIDMGSRLGQFGDIAYTLYPQITETQRKNRLYLQKHLIDVGFAPFLGEWWHFSYGDKEWAFYYKKEHAIYDKIEPGSIKNLF